MSLDGGSNMQCMTVLYPNKEGATFDFDYYMHTHIPFANGLLGRQFKVAKGIASIEGGPPMYLCSARMEVGTMEEFLPVLSDHAEAIMNDFPNYTNVYPVILFEEML
jgi:uncharacterized protein (TIGR02118 family)